MSALSVHLNREKPREIDAPASFSAHRPFDIALENHGDSSRVHVQLDETLSSVARLAEREQRVPEGATEHIRVNVEAVDQPVTGELSISLGYGASTATTTVTIGPPQQEEYDITIDESLGTPKQPAETRTRTPSVRALALVAIAGIALLAALAVALTVESPVVLGAAVTVAIVAVVGVIAALY